ncbi:MAG: hypothetical protein NTX41_09295 [Verrucomicrobia bacterium]|nr:hypothetical protein [Verrucomicrobiota bacterium]
MHRTLLLAVAAFALGCKPQSKVTSYEVKSDAPAPATAVAPATPVAPVAKAPEAPKAPVAATPMPANAAMQAEAASFGQPKWAELPAGWTAGAPNAMRKGSWNVAGPGGSQAEVAVTVFPGNVGGTTANVNRWRGQLGLAPAADADIQAAAQPGKIGADAGQYFRLDSPDGKKAMVALMVPKNDSTWFFKFTGDRDAVNAQTAAFLKFLATSQIP